MSRLSPRTHPTCESAASPRTPPPPSPPYTDALGWLHSSYAAPSSSLSTSPSCLMLSYEPRIPHFTPHSYIRARVYLPAERPLCVLRPTGPFPPEMISLIGLVQASYRALSVSQSQVAFCDLHNHTISPYLSVYHQPAATLFNSYMRAHRSLLRTPDQDIDACEAAASAICDVSTLNR